MLFSMQALFKETTESLYIVGCVHAKPLTVDKHSPVDLGMNKKVHCFCRSGIYCIKAVAKSIHSKPSSV